MIWIHYQVFSTTSSISMCARTRVSTPLESVFMCPWGLSPFIDFSQAYHKCSICLSLFIIGCLHQRAHGWSGVCFFARGNSLHVGMKGEKNNTVDFLQVSCVHPPRTQFVYHKWSKCVFKQNKIQEEKKRTCVMSHTPLFITPTYVSIWLLVFLHS